MMDQEMETAARGGPDGGGNTLGNVSRNIITPPSEGVNPRSTAQALVANGYHPVPIKAGTKECHIEGWSRWCAACPTPEDIDAWPSGLFAGVGIACGSPVVAIDIDLMDEREADNLEALAVEHFGQTPLRRVGKAPKRALLYRATERFDLMRRVGLDVIAHGGYLVTYGVHPDTGRPYSWGDRTPMNTPVAELPAITPEQLSAFLDASGLPEHTGEGGGKLQDIVRDPVSGLVTDGREAHLLLCVLQAARNAPDDLPGPWVEAAWAEFERTTDLTRPNSKLTIHEALRKATYAAKRVKAGKLDLSPRLSLDDFRAYMPMHNYIFAPSRDFWPAASVDSRLPKIGKLPASKWLDCNRPVEQITWYPGLPEVIENRLIAEGGWIERRGATCFNLYRPPADLKGDPTKAGPWLEHVAKVYPEEHQHLIHWFAHRVQRPGEKVNHGLILGGAPGIGKDTLLAPIKTAVGFWNFNEVSPIQIIGRFNGFLKSVILRISEARDLGGNDLSATNRYQLYEHLKTFTAAPPEVLRVDEKHLREYSIPNVLGVVITSNYQDGIYLPPDDRRFFVAWSEATQETFPDGYWQDLYGWFAGGGAEHVAAYLGGVDLSGFDPKAPPPKTSGFWAAVDAGRSPEVAGVADALDKMGNPEAVVLSELAAHADEETFFYLAGPKNARKVPHLLGEVGYLKVVNEGAQDGKWKVDGKRQTIYARRGLSQRERLKAAQDLTRCTEAPF